MVTMGTRKLNVLARHTALMLNFHRNTLVREHSFPQIGCAKHGCSADFCYEAVSLV